MASSEERVFAILIILVTYLLICAPLGALLVPYTINSWLLYVGKQTAITWKAGALIGCIPGFGQLIIPAAGLTWIIMLFLA